MAKQTNDKEQLKGILKEFDLGQAKQVLCDLCSDLMPKVSEFKNQGEKCSHGQDGCIGEKEFAQSLEAIWGQNNLLSAHFLTEGAEIQKAIAMVTLKVAKQVTGGVLPAGSGWGSGFLISNSLFMTNNHVIPNEAFCDDVNMQFMYQDNYNTEPAISSEFFETNEDSFFYTDAGLDYTIVRLKRKPYLFRIARSAYRLGEDMVNPGYPSKHEYADTEQIEELKYLSDFITKKQPISAFDPARILQIFGYTPGSRYGFIPLRPTVSYPIGLRLNVIQHPQGRKKEVVVQQNELRDVHTNVIHYYSDTDYGSSGSPVFNNIWDLMALHHARTPAESANEGIRIDKIVADLRSEFQTSNPGLLTELGI
ncbi:MAG: trypsin-like serine peptidase [Planctomycetota bacterium]|jgi:V8-like Glu-specific endopeptidase